jgi:Nuclease-related domain.
VSGVEGRRGAAGWSAAAWAEEARQQGRGGLLRRTLAALGVVDAVTPKARAVAGRREAGARGEQMTAELLEPLAGEGWRGWHDRVLPGGSRANVDHLLVPPGAGLLILVDSKLWAKGRGPVRRTARGTLRHGGEDRQGAVRSLLYEARMLQQRFDVPVAPVMCVHSAPVAGGRFHVGDVIVVGAGGLLTVLRGLRGKPDPAAAERLALRVDAGLPRYAAGPVRDLRDRRTQ